MKFIPANNRALHLRVVILIVIFTLRKKQTNIYDIAV